MSIPNDHRLLFEYFFSLGGRAKFMGNFVMIWHIIVYSIWKVHNDNIFNDVSTTTKEVEDKNIFWPNF